MENVGYRNFRDLIVTLYSDFRMSLLGAIYSSKSPVTLAYLAERTGSPFWMKMPHKMKPYIKKMEDMRLVSESNGRYTRGDLLNLVMSTVKKYPVIHRIRYGDSKNSDLNEEKILMHLGKVSSCTVDELRRHLKASERAYISSISNLKRAGLVRVATYRHKYFKKLKDADSSSLGGAERQVYLLVDGRGDSPVSAIDIIKTTNAGAYARGVPSLIDKGILSVFMDSSVSYGLTIVGRGAATGLQKLYDAFSREERVGSNAGEINWENALESLRRFNKF